MRIRAAAAWVGLTLAGMSLPAMAAAQSVEPADPTSPIAPSDVAAPSADSTNVHMDAPAPSPDGPSQAVTRLTRWVTVSGDNQAMPFVVIDKIGARVFVFDVKGRPLGAAPALVGITRGDESTPGVGDRELSHIPVKERTTPAGRFIAKFGPAKRHPPVLWVDYVDAISLHPVVTANKKEHRLQRINSPTPDDNRITFGCINIPASFYGKLVRPLFRKGGGVVYILPDTKSLAEVFPAMQLALSASGPAQIAASATAPSRSAAAQAQR